MKGISPSGAIAAQALFAVFMLTAATMAGACTGPTPIELDSWNTLDGKTRTSAEAGRFLTEIMKAAKVATLSAAEASKEEISRGCQRAKLLPCVYF